MDYDRKFTFAWKGGVLDFSYEEDGALKSKKHFDLDKKEEPVILQETQNPEFWNRYESAQITHQPGAYTHLPPVVQVVDHEPEKVKELVDALPGNNDEFRNDYRPAPEPVEAVPVVEATEVAKTEEMAPEVKSEPVAAVLNEDDPKVPTVKVMLPAVIPQIMEIAAVETDPERVVMAVTDASIKVSDGAELHVIKTAPGESDVVVAMTPEVKEAFAKVGVDPLEAIKQGAISVNLDAPKLPDLTPTLSPDAEAPPVDVIPQVVGMTVVDDTVHLTNISENIPKDATLVPIETPPEMPNIVAAIDADTMAAFAEKKLDPAEELAKFLAESDTEIATVTDLDEKEVADTFGVEETLNEYPEGRRRWWRRWVEE